MKMKWWHKVGSLLLAGVMSLPPGGGVAWANSNDADIRRDAAVVAIERVLPSVVNIRTSKLVRRNTAYENYVRRFYGLEDIPSVQERPSDIGSGVIVDEVGDVAYILTNVHVVGLADRVQVQLWDGREYEAEKMFGTTQKDLALLRIVRRPGDKPFQPIPLAKDDDLLLGETVIAVGNPFGLGGSVSRGILSSKNRRDDAGGQKLDFPDWLQTDADINPGNSGGPLINIRGELIGINVAVYSPSEGKGTGFAIPVKYVSSALSDFFTLEWTAKLWLGARLRGAPYPLSVREVQPGSPADRAGMRVGQQIVAVNGKAVTGLAGFNQLTAENSNRRASITVLENGARRVLNVELVLLTELNRQLLLSRLGLDTKPVTEAQAANYQLGNGSGWSIEEVERNSPAANVPLKPGMIVTEVDGVAASDLVNISNVLGNKKRGEIVRLTVKVAGRYGGGALQVVTLAADLVVR
jgi:serine protease Do